MKTRLLLGWRDTPARSWGILALLGTALFFLVLTVAIPGKDRVTSVWRLTFFGLGVGLGIAARLWESREESLTAYALAEEILLEPDSLTIVVNAEPEVRIQREDLASLTEAPGNLEEIPFAKGDFFIFRLKNGAEFRALSFHPWLGRHPGTERLQRWFRESE